MSMASRDSPAKRNKGKQVAREEEEDEDPPVELEGFDDFTIASSWERFISEIESICRLWQVDGPKNLKEKGAKAVVSSKNLYKVKSELTHGLKSYFIEYYFETISERKALEWNGDVHNLQLSFGINEFLVIAPVSASGVVLDAPESSKLLSSVAIALSNCGSNWPAFVPVHDPSRKAYIGIQNMGTVFTRRFEADRIGSQVPIKLLHLEGLYELFVSKFILSSSDLSTSYYKVHVTMKLTYQTPPFDDDGIENADSIVKEPNRAIDNLNLIKPQWDDDCPWTEWYSAEDPIKGFELTAMWSSRTFEGSLEMAELENASSFDADNWLLFPVISRNMLDDSAGKSIGFASQLRLLVNALELSFEAKFLEDFVSVENQGSDNSKSGSAIPPPSVLDRVLKELFLDGAQLTNYSESENKHSRAIKGASLESLFSQFCLHSLWFGNCNIRAIAALWIEFVREVRWCWEESQPLPRVSADSGIDLSACLIHQKLQLLAICIKKKRLLNHTQNESYTSDSDKEDYQSGRSQSPDEDQEEKSSSSRKNKTSSAVDVESKRASPDLHSANPVRRGSAGVIDSMTLLRSYENMHAPYTQDPPLMTEDMHEDRLHAVEAFGDTFNFSGQLEREILASDMSAFKAANPDAVFEDFIRWHSPGDWENDGAHDVSSRGCSWPPRGKLSQRMSDHGNFWRQIWNDCPVLPAAEQKPLLDPVREGEKIIHYLETLRPHQLLEQMVCTAFRAAADTLSRTSYGGFKQMKIKLDQLFLTIASALRKTLQGYELSDKTEMIGDLRRLCVAFEHIEKLLTFAASVYRKLMDANRLSQALFNDFFDFYLPKMGTSLESSCYDKKFNAKQQVNMYERDVVASMFPPPTANQSWRKVLSMGNLLNGHEPIVREIIFRVYDRASNCQYGSNNTRNSAEEIETHRMYVCGTSNDLQVALAVTSWD